MLKDNTEVRGQSPKTKKKSWQLNVTSFPELSGMLQLHFFLLNSASKNRSFPAQNWGQRIRVEGWKEEECQHRTRTYGS